VHAHPHPHPRPAWGEPRPGPVHRLVRALRDRIGPAVTPQASGLGELPPALGRSALAAPYLEAEGSGDHPAAAAAASDAAEHAISEGAWWNADAWAHRALWHFERAEMTLEATRQARRIGDLRTAAGDPDTARRYYAEAIDEARDIGAEREQGLAALGLGRALLDLGEVTQARRLGAAAVTMLERSAAPAGDLTAARDLLGTEVSVGEGAEEGH
jgi:tetratricopeptide (TPR) repeat protein